MFTRKDFKIDLVFPVAQAITGAIIATQLVGRLGHFAVSLPSTLLLGVVGATIAAIAERHFRDQKETFFKTYAPIPAGLLVALPVHLLLFPEISLTAVISVKGFIVLSGVLAAIRYASDHVQNLLKTKKEEPIATV